MRALVFGAMVTAPEDEDPLAFRVSRVQRAIVRRAEAFMRGRLGEPLTLHDICRAARASQRTVESAFSSVYGMGPKQYLKVLRLNEVRHVLKAGPWEQSSVKAVAYRFGFWHLGHFFTDYRRLFGETPSADPRAKG